MKDHSDADRDSTRQPETSLDKAIERCVLVLEAGDIDQLETLLNEHPQHEQELREFLADWGSMEAMVSQLPQHSSTALETTTWNQHRPSFDDFELLEKIGQGGMGEIYKARQVSLNRIVALKLLIRDQGERDRFRVEAEAIAAMAHPNIVAIYEIGEYEGQSFFTMQYVEGCNLREYVERQQVSSKTAAAIVETVARAIYYAHQRGILHRDLKPANILMDVDGQPHITDFGLAKNIARDTELTTSGTIMGTPGYMAPEQATGKIRNLTVATDVYGLGAILYALLTGEAPFTGDSTLEVIRQVSEQDPKPPRSVRPEVERDLETICLKCLEKKSEHRYATAEELANDLSRFVSGLPVHARPVPATEKVWRWCRRNPAVAVLGSIAVLLLLATTIASILLALSERNARISSDRNAQREAELTKNVTAALVEEQRTKSKLHLANGQWHARNGDVASAMLWFAEAAADRADNPRQLAVHRRRWQSWYREHPHLVAATQVADGYAEVEKGAWDRISFRPYGNELLIEAGSRLLVWDFQLDTIWNLDESYDQAMSAAWHPTGNRLAVGCRNGRLLIIAVSTRQIVRELDTGAPVTQIAFAADGQRVAIANERILRVIDLMDDSKSASLEHGSGIVAMEFHPERNRIVTVSRRRVARLIDFDHEPCLAIIESPIARVKPSEFLFPLYPVFVQDGRSLMARTQTRQLSFFDVESGRLQATADLPPSIFAMATAGQNLLVTGQLGAEVYRIKDLTNPSEGDTFATSVADELENAPQRRPRPSPWTIGDDDPESPATPGVAVAEVGEVVDAAISRPLVRMFHPHNVTNCDYGSQGLMATSSWDQNVRIWPERFPDDEAVTVQQKTPLAVLPHQTRLRQVRFSRDARYLATVQVDGLIRVFELPAEPTKVRATKLDEGLSLAKIMDEYRFITTGTSQWREAPANCRMYNLVSGTLEASTPDLTNVADGTLQDAVCSVDGSRLVTIHAQPRPSTGKFQRELTSTGTIRIWRGPDRIELDSEIQLNSEPRWIAHHPRDHQVAVCTVDMDVVLVDTDRGAIEAVLKREREPGEKHVYYPMHAKNEELAYSPDGKSIVVWSSRNRGCYVWDIEQRRLRFPCIENDGWPVTFAEFSRCGQYIVLTGGRNRVVRVIDAISGQPVGKTLEHTVVTYAAHFCPNARLVVTACRDGKARVFNWRTGDRLFSELAHEADVVDAIFTPDAQLIVSIGRDRKMKIWNVSDGTLAARPVDISSGARIVRVTPDSKYAIISGDAEQIHVAKISGDESRSHLDLPAMQLVSQLLSNTKIVDSVPVKIGTSEWYAIWSTARDVTPVGSWEGHWKAR